MSLSQPSRDLVSRLDAAESILAAYLPGASVSTLEAPSVYRDRLASSKHRRFRQRMAEQEELRRREAHMGYAGERPAR